MSSPIYFDHAATTHMHACVVEAMLPYLGEMFGNPTELHTPGQLAREGLEAARAQVAAVIGAGEREIVFTSGGTESDNLALIGTLQLLQPGHVAISAVEHPAVMQSVRFLQELGWDATLVSVDRQGVLDLDVLEAALRPDTRMVSVMLANNVVGTLQPVREVARLAHERGILVHTDAVQAFGSVPVDVDDLGVDLLAASSHKIYGPKGTGALYVRRGTKVKPLIHGGGQERGIRSGTENVAGIVGFGAAAEIAERVMPEAGPRLAALRDRLVAGVLDRVPDVELLGHPTCRLPGSACLSIAGVQGEPLVLQLDAFEIAASAGSACASSSLEPSHVLTAMGYGPEQAHGSLRLTLGRENTDAEVERFLEVLPGIVSRLREIRTAPVTRQRVL